MRPMKSRSDEQLQRGVLDELRRDPGLLTTSVGVGVRDGVVTLTGSVDSWARRDAAGKAAHRVADVLDVANDLEVRPPSLVTPDDTQVAAAARTALQADAGVPHEAIRTTVAHGIVTLTGEVERWSQLEDALRAIRNVAGVKLVINQMRIVAPAPEAIRPAIEDAVVRRARQEVRDLRLTVDDGEITVAGTVDSPGEKGVILDAVRRTDGVRAVRDELTVRPER